MSKLEVFFLGLAIGLWLGFAGAIGLMFQTLSEYTPKPSKVALTTINTSGKATYWECRGEIGNLACHQRR